MRSVDIFCRVIDNYGDIGVCWRLARQLSDEYGLNVRLIVDDLGAFCFIAPMVDTTLETQTLSGVTVLNWGASALVEPASIVIEAFACDPPEAYVNAMAAMTEKPTWLNLEYLSAEAWVDGVHGLPSPHPRLPLTKYFFCPGFSSASGGLIRERALTISTDSFAESASRRERPRLFAFAYPRAPIRAVSEAFNAEVTVACPFDDAAPSWRRATPVPQPEFDALLAQFDVLVVRGEDSFVRAQYAAKPMLWHIYPTPDDAHIVKLDAWLARYCVGLDPAVADAIRSAHLAFNRGDERPEMYAPFALQLPAIRAHAKRWRDHLCAQTDLATRLLAFISLKESQKTG